MQANIICPQFGRDPFSHIRAIFLLSVEVVAVVEVVVVVVVEVGGGGGREIVINIEEKGQPDMYKQ